MKKTQKTVKFQSFSELKNKCAEIRKKNEEEILKNRIEEFNTQTKEFFKKELEGFWYDMRDRWNEKTYENDSSEGLVYETWEKPMKTFLAAVKGDESSEYFDENLSDPLFESEWCGPATGFWLEYLGSLCEENNLGDYVNTFCDAAWELSKEFSGEDGVPDWATEAVKRALDILSSLACDMGDGMEEYRWIQDFTFDDWDDFLDNQSNRRYLDFEISPFPKPFPKVEIYEAPTVSTLSSELDEFFFENFERLSKKEKISAKSVVDEDYLDYGPGSEWRNSFKSYGWRLW